jgi:putative ABC transport system substrate-binding protein
MDMRRREFIAFAGGAAAIWPLATRAQQPGKLPTIGFLGAYTASVQRQWTAAFEQRLRELGWIEGRNLAVEYRWAEGRPGYSVEVIAEFIRLKVDVIVTHATANVTAAKQATSVIPIVMAAVADPVADGLVASLARPGGNITGLSLQSSDLAGKRIELLREIIPGLRRLAIMTVVGDSGSVLEIGQVQAAARKLGLEIVTSEIRQAADITPAFEALKSRADAFYGQTNPLIVGNRARINTLALGARMPTIYGTRVLCPTEQTSRTCSGAPPIMSTKFCMGQSRLSCRSSSRPYSISSST